MHTMSIQGLLLTSIVILTACGRPSDGTNIHGEKAPSEGIADKSLVAWWTFNEGSGTTTADASGKGNTGTIRNAGWGGGKIGNALQMNGGNDSIMTVPLSDSLRSTAAEITVMGWAYRTAAHNVAVIAHGYPTLFLGFHGQQFKWQVVNEKDESAGCYADPKYQAVLNQWFHLTGTYDGRTARLYVDGVQICREWLSRAGGIKMPDVPFTVSGYLDTTGNVVDEITGMIDEVRIYNRTLSADEIQNIYSTEK
jgi:hypothetical protein